MLGVKICCKPEDLLSMQTSWSKDNPGQRFWSCPRYRNACNFFRWRDHRDVDIRSKFVIVRLVNIIKELKIDDENHIKRSNKCVMKEKNKTKCCNNWKLIFVLFVVFCTPVPTFLLVLNITYESNVATDDLSVATSASNVATYHPYVATFDHLRHMLLQMTHILLQMTHILLHMRHM
ncbi:hypothetical protein H5410_032775 [Solanum commersonii]|uniref:GRF-type domain-containing protein n=1 Tax=Solanum commersonii TaxID=4109 RepID=A0A9J5YN79_SOLCO|nr:hypothetical protein H5410_032775 [Solanum commersonii]